jgi:hypothetical protein
MVQRILGIALCALLLTVPACKIEIKEGSGGGGGGGGTTSSSSTDDGSAPPPSDDGNAQAEPAPEPKRTTTSTSSSDQPRQKRWYVYGMRDRYPNLPDMGETKKYWRALPNEQSTIDQGYMNGDLNLNGNGFIKQGAGPGQTVIDGHCEIQGNGWVLKGMTITGNLKVRGNNNDISGCEVLGGPPDVRGTGNKFPAR